MKGKNHISCSNITRNGFVLPYWRWYPSVTGVQCWYLNVLSQWVEEENTDRRVLKGDGAALWRQRLRSGTNRPFITGPQCHAVQYLSHGWMGKVLRGDAAYHFLKSRWFLLSLDYFLKSETWGTTVALYSQSQWAKHNEPITMSPHTLVFKSWSV